MLPFPKYEGELGRQVGTSSRTWRSKFTTKAASVSTRFAGSLSSLFTHLRVPLYTNAFYLWVSAAGTALAGFVFWALVTRFYGTDDVGLGSAALSALSLLAMFSHLGLGLGLIRFLPDSGKEGPRLANAVFTSSALVAVSLSTAFLAGLPLWVPSLDFLREQPLYAVAFIAFVVAATLSYVQTYTFIAVLKAKYILVQTVVVLLGRLVLLVLMSAFFGMFGIVASGGLAVALGAVIGFSLLAKGLPGYQPRPVVDWPSVLRLLPFSAGNYVADSLLVLPSLVLPLVVVGSLGSTEGAYFYMAWFLGHLLISSSAYLGLSLFAAGSNDPNELRLLSRNAVAVGLAVAAVGALCFLLLGDKLLLVFGSDYATEGATLLRLVALAAVPAAVVNVYLGALRVTKRVSEMVIIAGVVSVTTLVLSSALLPVMGLTGAGIGIGLGQGLGLIVVLGRLLAAPEGAMPQRMRWLLGTLSGRSQVRTELDTMQVQGNGPTESGDVSEELVLQAKAERKLSVTALICTLNEEENLPHVLPGIPAWVDEVLLVDGHSTDDTVLAAKKLRPDMRILFQPGRGKGDALKCGIEQANGDIIVTLDADGTTDPVDMPRFVAPLVNGYDFVKGSRFALSRPAGKPGHRIFGNRIIVTVYNVLFRTNYTDLCSGYNAFWKRAIASVDLSDWTNQEEPLLNARVRKAGLKVLEVGHHDRGRIGGETKQPSLRQGTGAIRTVIRERFRG